MKRRIFLILSVFLALNAFGAEKVHMTDDELDYAELVNSIHKADAPYLEGDHVIFTEKRDCGRHVGIAFEHENFRVIHSFKIKKFMDMEYNETGSLFFYILKLPKSVVSVNYRLVIDGLWTTDPLNDNKQFNSSANLMLSHFDASREMPPVTHKTSSAGGTEGVHFVYQGTAGQSVRLGGSFTNWDSWIYQMKEVSPGLYEFDLPLPPGTYEYAFYTGITSFPDAGNPQKCYTVDGKIASLIVVE